MKLISIILFVLFFIQILYAQPTCESCKDKEYMYHFCKDGQTKEKCTSNPYNEAGCTLLKKCLPPADYYYDEDPFMKHSFGYDYNQDGNIDYSEYYFDRYDAAQQAEDALNEWESICSPIDSYGCFSCPLHITWTTDKTFFKNYPECLALYTGKLNADCRPDCSQEFIYINIDDDQTGWNSYSSSDANPTKRFFYTNSDHKTAPNPDDPTKDMPLYSFKTTIEHEIGHWLGFAHQKDNTVLWWGSCGDPNGIMHSTPLPPATDWSMSDEDKCMYMKIYCCPDEHTSVNDEINNNNVEFILYPNPVIANAIKLHLNDNISLDTKTLRIISDLGESLIQQQLKIGSNDYTIDISSLGNGSYTLLIVSPFGKKIMYQRFIIQR
jgi:hypothetical protein